MEASAGAQTPSRLEEVLGAQIGSQILQLSKQAVLIESLQAEVAALKQQIATQKPDADVLSPV